MTIDLDSIAYPYAKAIFNFSVKKNNIRKWKKMLFFIDKVLKNKKVKRIINCAYSYKYILKILFYICDKEIDLYARNLIRVVSKNNRLLIFSFIFKIYLRLIEDFKKVLYVTVITQKFLNEKQIQSIQKIGFFNLYKEIKIKNKIDSSIIGGIILKIGNTTIDNSIRGKLKKLSSFLKKRNYF